MTVVALTIAIVDIRILNNVTWEDAFQYGDVDDDTGLVIDTSWSFTGKSFKMDLKSEPTNANTDALLKMTSTGGEIVVLDAAQRILGFNVTDTAIRAALSADTTYYYDLIMVDDGTGARTPLMQGTITVEQGVTVED